MRKLKSILLVVMAVLMALPVFAGGSKDTAKAAGTPDDPVTIDLWFGAAVTEAGMIPDDWVGYDIIREKLGIDLKLTMDIVAGPMDLYLGGGAGIAAGNPLGDAVISGNLAQGEFTLGSADFAWDWFASAVAGVRFYMGDVFSLGAEVGYRYMVGAKQHIGSADIVLGFTF